MKKFFVIMLAVAALVALSVPAWAEGEPGPQFTVGGRVLTDIGYHTLSKELTQNGDEDVTSAFINVAGHSYLRALYASADKTFGGLVELGLASRVGGQESASLRYAYGWWKVGNCRLVAGHTDGWVGTLIHAPKQYLGATESAKLLLANWGYTYSARAPQVRLEWMSGNYGFAIAAVQPGSELLPNTLKGDLYATLPRFDLAAQFRLGGFWAQPGFGWSQLKGADGDDSVTAWIAILPMKYTTGPFTAKAEVHYGQNKDMEWSGELIKALRALPRSMPFGTKDNGDIENTKQLGGFLALEYKLSPALEVTAGYGFAKLSNNAWVKDSGWNDDNYTRQAYFVALPCQVTKNFSLQPEFNYFNYGDAAKDGQPSGNEWMLGLQVRFVF